VETESNKNKIMCRSFLNNVFEELYSYFWEFVLHIYQTSCTLHALLCLQFNLNETRYFVLIVFIEALLNDKTFWECTLQICKISLQSPQGTADHLVTGHLVTCSLTYLDNFPLKIVASMIVFIIFFTGHLVT
jgi:hypothetical protein